MAQKVQTILIDDLTGEPLGEGEGETVSFGIDGVSYEIDISNDAAAELREAIALYVEKARRVGGRRTSQAAAVKPQRKSSDQDFDPAAVRAWAASNDIEVSPRGRIKADVVARFQEAMG